MAQTTVEKFVSTPDGQRAYQQDRALEAVSDLLCELMANKGITRADLAKRLGKSPGWVTQSLDGDRNKTIRTLSDLFWALGHSMQFVAGSLDIHELPPQSTESTTVRAYPDLEFNLTLWNCVPDSSAAKPVWQGAVSTPYASQIFDISLTNNRVRDYSPFVG